MPPKKKKHKKRAYRKSRYYRRRQQLTERLLIGCGAVLILLLLIILVRGCSARKNGTVKTNASAKSQDETSASDADLTPTPTMAPVSLTVSVVGDCTLGTDENFDYDTSLNAYYENYGADYFFSNVKSIFSADDLTIANFEGTLTDSDEREDKEYAFKAPAEYTSILTAGSVEAVNTANNHSHDYGDQSYTDTIQALDNAGILNFGYDKTVVTEVKGIKIGLVGIYELKDHLGREEQLKQNIAKVKADGAQITIVIFH